MTNSTLCLDFETPRDTPNLLTVALAWIKKANAVYRQRLALKNMSASQLQDIAVSRQDATREASRSFWDI
ncbi:MAG: DUF1127 domain-containing protein [Rhodospirillaceae bacterium]|nr:MAG: DUF1127 domain-containing protein [Rhodospirillaceae bacterium]